VLCVVWRIECSDLTASFLKPQLEEFESQQQRQSEQKQRQAQESPPAKAVAKSAEPPAHAPVPSPDVSRSRAMSVGEDRDALKGMLRQLGVVCLSAFSQNRQSVLTALMALVAVMVYINLKLPTMLLVGVVMVVQIPDQETINRWKDLISDVVPGLGESDPAPEPRTATATVRYGYSRHTSSCWVSVINELRMLWCVCVFVWLCLGRKVERQFLQRSLGVPEA
jgi:hypothetical protein